MPRRKIFVKVSGDLFNRQEVIDWLGTLTARKENFVVICVGGGTQINQAFANAGFEVGAHGPLGRETKSFDERQLARDTLEVNQREVQDRLATNGIAAVVEIPVIYIGTVLCHVNGDIHTLAAYHGFEELYILTTQDRVVKKQQDFALYPKIKVVGF